MPPIRVIFLIRFWLTTITLGLGISLVHAEDGMRPLGEAVTSGGEAPPAASALCNALARRVAYFDNVTTQNGLDLEQAWKNPNVTQLYKVPGISARVDISPSSDCQSLSVRIKTSNRGYEEERTTSYIVANIEEPSRSIAVIRGKHCYREFGRLKCSSASTNVNVICIDERCWNLDRLSEDEMLNSPTLLNSSLLPEERRTKALTRKRDKYLTAYSSASTSRELEQFVADFGHDDPDKLVPKAKAKIDIARKREAAEAVEAERKNILSCDRLYAGKAVSFKIPNKFIFDYGDASVSGTITGISSKQGVASAKITSDFKHGEVVEKRCIDFR